MTVAVLIERVVDTCKLLSGHESTELSAHFLELKLV
jgi:hypothetical protein